MADRYLLESGAPDGYLLEDGSGVYLLESSGGGGSYTAPTRRNVTSQTGTGTALGGPGDYNSAIVVTKPTGTADGDLCFVVIATDGNATGLVQTLAGWTAYSFNPLRPTLDGQRIFVFWKIASGEPSSWTWLSDVGNGVDWTAQAVSYTGQGATWNVDTEHTTVDSSSGSSPLSTTDSGVTTSTANTLLLYIAGGDPNSANSGSWTDPSGYTAGAQSYANYAPLMLADKVQAAAGASGSVAGTLTFASGNAGYAAAVIPITGMSSGGGDISLSLDTAGAITVAGQSITAAITAALSGGAITAAGQSLTFRIGEALTNGSVTIAGQSLTFATSTALGGGAITLAGQDLTLASGANLALSLDAGAITVAGQSLAFATDAALSSGTVTIAGQSVALSLPSNLALALDAGAITIAGQDVAFDLQGVQPEQPTGGWGYFNDYQRERQLAAARKRRRELEDEADRLEMALAAEGLTTPAPEVVARFTVREYANAADTFSRRTQRAIAYAERAQTALAYELAARQLQKEIDDEESAIAMLLALVA